MSDNYAVINGKRVELTDEQVKALGIETEINPFNRMGLGSYCYAPHYDGTARTFTEDGSTAVNLMHRNCNYFNDKDFAEQVALHQLLYRKLLKFAYDNGCEDTAEWDCRNRHYHIIGNFNGKDFGFDSNDVFKQQGTVYFSSKEGALQAIKEVVKPFMKEHPEFVW